MRFLVAGNWWMDYNQYRPGQTSAAAFVGQHVWHYPLRLVCLKTGILGVIVMKAST